MRPPGLNPFLKDLRVRQAINMAFGRTSMINSLYGDVAEPLHADQQPDGLHVEATALLAVVSR